MSDKQHCRGWQFGAQSACTALQVGSGLKKLLAHGILKTSSKRERAIFGTHSHHSALKAPLINPTPPHMRYTNKLRTTASCPLHFTCTVVLRPLHTFNGAATLSGSWPGATMAGQSLSFFRLTSLTTGATRSTSCVCGLGAHHISALDSGRSQRDLICLDTAQGLSLQYAGYSRSLPLLAPDVGVVSRLELTQPAAPSPHENAVEARPAIAPQPLRVSLYRRPLAFNNRFIEPPGQNIDKDRSLMKNFLMLWRAKRCPETKRCQRDQRFFVNRVDDGLAGSLENCLASRLYLIAIHNA